MAVDDGVNVIKPTDVGGGSPGRWLISSVGAALVGLEFGLVGVYSGAALPGFYTAPRLIKTGFSVSTVSLTRRISGTAGTTIVDVRRNGVSLYLTPGDLPTIAAGADYTTVFAIPTAVGGLALAANDVIDAVLTSVETALVGPPPGPEGFNLIIWGTGA
jgi:hypothetical protein